MLQPTTHSALMDRLHNGERKVEASNGTSACIAELGCLPGAVPLPRDVDTCRSSAYRTRAQNIGLDQQVSDTERHFFAARTTYGLDFHWIGWGTVAPGSGPLPRMGEVPDGFEQLERVGPYRSVLRQWGR